MIPIHRATIKDGIIKYQDTNYFLEWFYKMKGEVEVIIRPFKDTRTERQNRYYWAYMKLIAKETGDDENDLHEYFKRKHLTPKFVTVLGKEIKLPNSTTKLKKDEFSEYIKKIERETGINAPDINSIDL